VIGVPELRIESLDRQNPRTWALAPGSHRVGRASSNPILITDPSVSREHAEIRVNGEKVHIEDIGSHNGTWVNGTRLTGPIDLRPGDRIRFGSFEVVLRGPGSGRLESTEFPATLSPGDQVSTGLRLNWDTLRAGRAASADQNRRLFLTVTEAGHLLAGIHPLQEVFDSVLELVQRVVPARRILLLLAEAEGEAPVVRAARPAEIDLRQKIMLSNTLLTEVLAGRESLLVTDARQDPRFQNRDSIVALNVHSALAAPLFDNERVIGLIYADTSDPLVQYDQDQLEALTLLANLIAVKITNTRLLEEQREKERMMQELATAAEIQRSLLPSSLPVERDYEIVARQMPSLEVAGDLYDAALLPDGTLGLVLGDVTGKGLGAALLMSSVILSLRILEELIFEPSDLVQRLHRQVHRTSESQRFVTLFFARLIREEHRLSFVNAGHNPPILLGPEGGVRMLDSTGPPVGLLDGAQFGVESVDLPPGSLLCVYSDGITEAMVGDEFYGDERLLASLRARADRPLEEVASGVFGDLAAFLAGAPAGDDITLLLLRRLGTSPSS
jgi:serine phosphatase RsbU (regulator of sigma subunit)